MRFGFGHVFVASGTLWLSGMDEGFGTVCLPGKLGGKRECCVGSVMKELEPRGKGSQSVSFLG